MVLYLPVAMSEPDFEYVRVEQGNVRTIPILPSMMAIPNRLKSILPIF